MFVNVNMSLKSHKYWLATIVFEELSLVKYFDSEHSKYNYSVLKGWLKFWKKQLHGVKMFLYTFFCYNYEL